MIIINICYFVGLYKKNNKKKKSELKQSINPLIQDLIDEMKASEHEYKNHLNILYCMIQVCKEDELRERAKKYIGNVFENKNLLGNLSYIDNTMNNKKIDKKSLKKMEEIQNKIRNNEKIYNYLLAEQKFNLMMDNINKIIANTIDEDYK